MDSVFLTADVASLTRRNFSVVWSALAGESSLPLKDAAEIRFEDARPVRGFSSYRGQRHFPGWYWAATTGGHVPYESWLERDHATLLDFDPRVVAFAAQPFWLTWQGANPARRHRHVPDFFARVDDGRAVVIDCRPADRVDARAELAFAATRIACEFAGWGYRVVGEVDSVRARNLCWLAGYRHPRHGADGSLMDRVRSAFAVPAPLFTQAASVGEPMMVAGRVSSAVARVTDRGSFTPAARPYCRFWTVVMSVNARRGVLRIGDRVRFCGQMHTVVGIAGATVRLTDELGVASLVLLSHLLAAEGFELLDSVPQAVPLAPFGLLDSVPELALRRARLLERHLIEAETGVAPDAPPGTAPRPEYDPKWRNVDARLAAKSAELAAAGTPLGLRQLQRLRAAWRDQGLWGLVDRRTTRQDSPTGRLDERVVAVLVELLNAQSGESTGTRSRLIRQARQVLDERYGSGKVKLPPQSTLYRVLPTLAAGKHTFGSATTRRSQVRRPNAPFTPSDAARPGENVQMDTTPLDVLVILDDGVTGRAELTIAVDVATRTICAAILRPTGTKAVDASLLLAQMLVPEPMRPCWPDALRMSALLVPHARLMSIDARLEHAAAKPVIVPETITIDHGKVFVSDTFLTACRTLGISVQPCRPRTPSDKGIVERTFASINTLFCQHVAGYVGSNATRRGDNVTAAWTIAELADLFDEFVVACWQHRPHDGLRSPFLPGKALSPNDAWALLIARAGHLPVCLSGEEYLELLPVHWRAINDYGNRSTTAPTTAPNSDPTAANRRDWTPRAGSGKSTTTPTTFRTCSSVIPAPEAGSPSPGPG